MPRSPSIVTTESLDVQKVLEDIDRILREAENIRTESDENLTRACLLLSSAIVRYALPTSPFRTQTDVILKQYGPANDYARQMLIGALKGIRHEYEHGLLNSVTELAHRDLFTDFLDMAQHLLEKGFKDPAAVIAAGVLEQHLRQLAQKHGVPLIKENGENTRAEVVNAELAKMGAYDTPTQKEVTAKLALRNQAAHAEWGKYELQQVRLFVDWVRFFIAKFPA